MDDSITFIDKPSYGPECGIRESYIKSGSKCGTLQLQKRLSSYSSEIKRPNFKLLFDYIGLYI